VCAGGRAAPSVSLWPLTGHTPRARRVTQVDPETRLVDEGKPRPQVGAVYPLADVREAFMAKSTQHIPGKVVLTP